MGFLEEKEDDLKIPLLQKEAISFKALFKYIIVSFMVLAHILSFTAYLGFKIRLYIKEYREVLASPWVIIILLCECGYYLHGFIYSTELLIPPWLNLKRPSQLPQDEKDFPTVDILLPCCREATDVLVDTILALLAMDYPKDKFKILVLDDGTDDDLKVYVESLTMETGGTEITYLRRKKIPGVPHHYKSGNLNYGLAHSNAEYVAMVDADMIMHPSFLRILLPHLIHSPNIAFVQVPQTFYNLPAGDPLNDANALFYEKILLQRHIWGCPTCVGTGAIFRRKHLDSVGGYCHESITEDCITAYVLLGAGYRAVYLNNRLQMGLAPWSLDRYLKQRERWCMGALQQFFNKRKSLLGKESKLNFLDKIIFFSYTSYYYLSFLNLIMLLIFICALAFHLKLSIGDHLEMRQFFAYLASYLVIWRLTWIVEWWGIPQHIVSRNREESHFWWMTPFFLETILRTTFPSIFTYTYLTTGSTNTHAQPRRSAWVKYIAQFKPLAFHLVYVFLVIPLVSWRSYMTHIHGGIHNCKELLFVGGISSFLLATCIHMLVPIIYLVWPTIPPERRSLFQRDADGVPQFSESNCSVKWHWLVIFYEIMSYCITAIWGGVLYIYLSEADKKWCKWE